MKRLFVTNRVAQLINGEKVEGWMEVAYKVDDAAILKTVKVGDQIMATVYDGDMVLHKVMVMRSKMAGPKGTGTTKPMK